MDRTTTKRWMEEAFRLALAARGTTLPNPAVGCIVLDKSGRKVAEAATSPEGRPHAERQALERAGAKARGGTLVVTLEPCVAFPGKKSPPCAAAAIVAGIETVIVGAADPNPQVAGRGLHALRKAGMEVLESPLDGAIPDFYAGFGHFLSHGIPRITVKIALSRDGHMTAASGERTTITGAESRRFVHTLRAASDAVLVGGRTAAIDDPALTVRDAPGRSPRRLVLWPAAGLRADLQLWDGPDPATALGTGPRPTTLPRQAAWVQLPADTAGHVDMKALLGWCGSRGMHDLLIEPGPALLESLLEQRLWDGLWVLRAPHDLPGGVAADPRELLPANAPRKKLALDVDLAGFWSVDDLPPIQPLS